MSELTAPSRNPWRSLRRHEPALALVYRELWARRGQLQQYDGVFTGVRFFTPEFQPAECSIGALLALWVRWAAFQGQCPDCNGRMLGAGCLCQLTEGLVLGVCLECALVAAHPLPGQTAVRHEVFNAIGPDRHRIKDVAGPENYQPLLAVLQEVGAEGLPAQTSVKSIFFTLENESAAPGAASAAGGPQAVRASANVAPEQEESVWPWLMAASTAATLLRLFANTLQG